MPIITIQLDNDVVTKILLELFPKAKIRVSPFAKTQIEFSGQKAVIQLLNYLDKFPLQYKYSQQIWMQQCINTQMEFKKGNKGFKAYSLVQKISIKNMIQDKPKLKTPFIIEKKKKKKEIYTF